MIFNSIYFVIFFLVTTFLYFITPYKIRWLLLLAASCYFYMFFLPAYILILVFTILTDYIAGIYIERSSGTRRKFFLIASLIANIGVLFIFKYLNFFSDNIAALLHYFGLHNPIPNLSILLPIGLSFHTFQAMSYTIEIYRGHQKAERHFGIYALYVMFYPQLMAGPIERPQNMLHQFYEKHTITYANFSNGFKWILWGFFKKLVIADRLSVYVTSIYENPAHHTSSSLILATIFFSFQIYCDFSGYSDIAIGTARVMGFKLMTNFNKPYLAESIPAFWRRWHISLSTWFTDYLYIPIGGNKVPIPRLYANLIFIFLVSGLWHGANWTFVIWGGLNGIYLIAAHVLKPFGYWLEQHVVHHRVLRLMYRLCRTCTTFILIAFSWIFFRAQSVSDAWLICQRIFTAPGPLFFSNSYKLIVYPVIGLIILFVFEFNQEMNHGQSSFFFNRSSLIRMASYCFLILVILLIGVFDGGEFIYFQF